MREILNDPNGARDADPMARAREAMRTPLPRRFYREAGIVEEEGGHAVRLDGKPVRTPGKNLLKLPSEAAARLVVDEFDAQIEVIDPMTMPVLRLANTAIDGVAGDVQAVLEDAMRFSATDLVCYRAEAPEKLAARQAEAWDPVLDWARATLGARFHLAAGVMHVEQPRESIAAVGLWLRQRAEPFRISAIHLITTLTGSALIALALENEALDADAAWAAAHVDEDWNVEQWGEDAEAAERRATRRRDFDAAVALLRSL